MKAVNLITVKYHTEINEFKMRAMQKIYWTKNPSNQKIREIIFFGLFY